MRAFSALSAYAGATAAIGEEGRSPERTSVAYVSANVFAVVGERPVLGRDFSDSDERVDAAAVAILENGLWQRRYGGDPAIVGRSVRLNGSPVAVIGVMPIGFKFPNNADIWRPLAQMPGFPQQPRDARSLSCSVAIISSRTACQSSGSIFARDSLENMSVPARVQDDG